MQLMWTFLSEMGKGKEVTPRKRAILIQYSKDGVKQRDISRKLKLSESVVSRIIKKYRATGSSSPRKRSGRPRVSSKREDSLIRRCAVQTPTISSLQIKINTGVRASACTIRRRLVQEFALRAHRPSRKPLITTQQRQKRILFCKKYKNWDAAKWSKVLFSDESTFLQFGAFTQFVRRPVGTRENIRYSVPTVKHSPKIMVWGSFSALGRGSLYLVNENQMVNGKEYVNILESKVRLTMQLHGCEVFQQDSAPAHTSRVAKKWFNDNGIQVLDWPGNSPDLNPIENLWTIMKRKVRKHHASNLKELAFYIKRVWCTEITPEVCQNLVSSMPRRILSVLKNSGYPTKY